MHNSIRRTLFKWVVILVFTVSLQAQEACRVIIRNGSDQNPKFIAALNGVRVSNSYNSSASFECMDEFDYRLRIWQAGAMAPLTFTLNNAPKYTSTYVLSRDNTGNYSLLLESKLLMEALPPAYNSTTLTTGPSSTVLVLSGQQIIKDEDYQGMLQAIHKENFENGKLDLAKTFFGAPGQYVSAEQVTGVLKLLSFENNRLSFAEFIYNHTLDKQNYYKVFNLFSFSNSKLELEDYIRKNNGE